MFFKRKSKNKQVEPAALTPAELALKAKVDALLTFKSEIETFNTYGSEMVRFSLGAAPSSYTDLVKLDNLKDATTETLKRWLSEENALVSIGAYLNAFTMSEFIACTDSSYGIKHSQFRFFTTPDDCPDFDEFLSSSLRDVWVNFKEALKSGSHMLADSHSFWRMDETLEVISYELQQLLPGGSYSFSATDVCDLGDYLKGHPLSSSHIAATAPATAVVAFSKNYSPSASTVYELIQLAYLWQSDLLKDATLSACVIVDSNDALFAASDKLASTAVVIDNPTGNTCGGGMPALLLAASEIDKLTQMHQAAFSLKSLKPDDDWDPMSAVDRFMSSLKSAAATHAALA